MTLGKQCKEAFGKLKEQMKLREKAIQIELAFRWHERALGMRPKGSFVAAVKRTESTFS